MDIHATNLVAAAEALRENGEDHLAAPLERAVTATAPATVAQLALRNGWTTEQTLARVFAQTPAAAVAQAVSALCTPIAAPVPAPAIRTVAVQPLGANAAPAPAIRTISSQSMR